MTRHIIINLTLLLSHLCHQSASHAILPRQKLDKPPIPTTIPTRAQSEKPTLAARDFHGSGITSAPAAPANGDILLHHSSISIPQIILSGHDFPLHNNNDRSHPSPSSISNGVSQSIQWTTQTLPQVIGPPGSYSQTSTSNRDGSATVLPVWFDAAGAAVVVAGAIGVGAAVPAPGVGFPALEIGDDGVAGPADDGGTEEGEEEEEEEEEKKHSSISEQTSQATTTSSLAQSSFSTSSSVVSSFSSSSSSISTSGSSSSISTFSSLSTSSSTTASSTSSSASASSSTDASTEGYLIFPKDGKDPALTAFTTQLQRLFGDDLVVVQSPVDGIQFWEAPLSVAQVAQFKANPAIDNVIQNLIIPISEDSPQPDPAQLSRPPRQNKRHKKRSPIAHTQPHQQPNQQRSRPNPNLPEPPTALLKKDQIIQPSARPEMVAFSHPPNTPTLPSQSYVYSSAAGAGSTIFIIDTGLFYPLSSDLKSYAARTPSPIEWIFPGSLAPFDDPWLGGVIDQDDTDPYFAHGTAMAAKAVGELYGVAKKASLVVVRPPRSRRQGNADMVGYTLGTLLDSLGKIADKVVSDPKSTKAVLNLSWGKPADMTLNGMFYALKFQTALGKLRDLGVVIVTAAGNDQVKSPNQATFPQAWSDILDVIVVGGVDANFQIAPFSRRGDFVSVYAPATGIKTGIAELDNDENDVQAGTSAAAASVSGLVAYLLSIDAVPWTPTAQTPKLMREKVKQLAYPRVAGGPPVAWNGMDWVRDGGLLSSSSSVSTLIPAATTMRTSSISAATPTAVSSNPSSSPPSSSPSPRVISSIPQIFTSKECSTLQHGQPNQCSLAWDQFSPTFTYTSYTSYIHQPNHDRTALGCGAVFICNDASEYQTGVLGQDLRRAFAELYDRTSGVPVCGQVSLGEKSSCWAVLDRCTGKGCNFEAQEGAPGPSGPDN